MASSPITSWQVDGETVRDFIFLGSITADGDCSHEIKRCLLLGRKVMTNLDSVLKSRDITWPTKVCLVRTLVFSVVMYWCESWTVSVVMYWCESWTVKKAEHRRIDAFYCGVEEDSWESLGQQGDPTKGNQSWIFIGKTDAEAETPILWPPDAKN